MINKLSKKVYVTKTFLPPFASYQKYLKKIWKNNQLTNQGPLLKEFESQVKKYLEVKYFHFVTNGTIALQVALKALDILEGEIITTPFSYVATTSAILWERCQPVFVDIEPNTFCIDADKIEKAINKKTRAILAVHVFGFPCDVEKIDKIAKKYNLKVIYDAAHAFGVKYKGRSLMRQGDISVGSFHATKVFHTIEGGCLIAKDKNISDKIELIKRFGHFGDNHVMLGINAKASEFQAAMGLCNLGYIEKIINNRDQLVNLYDKYIGNEFQRPIFPKNFKCNYAYYPVLFKDETQLLKVIESLKMINIYPRRYFYPSLNTLHYLNMKQDCPVSEGISSRILCLPLHSNLSKQIVKSICLILKQFKND